jgi:hypothetical protein
MPLALERTSRLPIVAIASVVLLIAAGWLFFLATFELSKVNYERKGGAPAYKAARAQQNAAKPVR